MSMLTVIRHHLRRTGLRPMQAGTAAAIRRALPEIQDHE